MKHRFFFAHYRIDGEVYTFYGPDQDATDEYAVRWARRKGYKRVTRLKAR